MQNHNLAGRRFLLGLFVVSGFTGLIYESIWSQYLKLFLGHAAYAQTVVLSIFMGGMALGSWVVARYGARLRQLLWGYLLVEVLIGILGILFHRVFVASTDLSFARVIPALHPGWMIYAYKWSLASLLVLPQSVLLGMTFPLISGGVIRRWPERAGETLATLYFTNSLGGALGVLVSGFVLINWVGLPGTTLTAGLLNILLAFGVWLVVRRQTEPPTSASAPAPAAPARRLDPVARWFAIAAFLTGAASFMYELGWIRMLSLVLGSSTHSFELMLSAFIFGLAFGGLYVRKRIEGIADPERYLSAIMLTMGALAALTVPACNLMYDFMGWSLATFTHTPGGYVAFNIVSQSIAILIMFPVTFCAGMTLPVLTRALMRQGSGEKAIGTIYSLNTLGAIAGVMIAVHILMPLIGVRGVILAGAGIHIALGLSRLRLHGWRQPSYALAVAASLAAFCLTAFFWKLDPMRVASGVFRNGRPTVPADAKVTYLRDGKTATITLVAQRGVVAIATNGKTDAAIQMEPGEVTSDESTMVLAAVIPLSLKPDAARVANIGFGSGLTTHTLLSAGPSIQRLDSIEIEPLMVEAARQGFGARIHDVFEDPRNHIVYEDAKTFFAASSEPYDLIVSEPSNPWVSGVASLFSDEFYGRVVHYLRPDGCFVQWVQIYETDVGIIASIVKALSRHFPAYAIYSTNDSDILIVATPAAALPALTDQVFKLPQLRTDLDRIGVRSPAELQMRLIGDDKTIGPLFNGMPVPVNSDYFPFVDLNAPRLRFMSDNALELPRLTTLPAPIQDLLRHREATAGTTLQPSNRSPLLRDAQVKRALAIHHALTQGVFGDLDPLSAMNLLILRTSVDKCSDPNVQATWKVAAANIGTLTASYLDPTELADMWNNIKATPCYRDTSGEHKAWADLFAVVAARDPQEIVSQGKRLLERPSPLTRNDLTYLTSTMAAAYIRTGQMENARNLLAAQWDRLDFAGDFSLSLREMQALAVAGRTQP